MDIFKLLATAVPEEEAKRIVALSSLNAASTATCKTIKQMTEIELTKEDCLVYLTIRLLLKYKPDLDPFQIEEYIVDQSKKSLKKISRNGTELAFLELVHKINKEANEYKTKTEKDKEDDEEDDD